MDGDGLSELQKEIQQMKNPIEEEPNDGGEGKEQGQESERQGQGEGQELQVEEKKEETTPTTPTTPVEQPEETLEQRYARILEELNSKNARILELEAGQGRTELVQPAAQIPEPPPIPQTPVPLQVPTLQLDLEKLKNGLIEDDADAVGQVLQSIGDYINKAVAHSRESIFLSIPEMADRIATQKVNLTLHVHEFYQNNPDLQAHRATCGAITNEVVSENPNQTLQQVFTEVEKRARQKLGLKKKIQEADLADDRSNPAFVKRPGSRKPGAPKLTGLAGDIAAMKAATGR